MPLEVECHTVPHLKALTRGKLTFLGGKNSVQKVLMLHHKTDQTVLSFDGICMYPSKIFL